MDRGNTRRDWDQFGGSGAGAGSTYPSGPPDFTKSSGPPDFSRDSYAGNQTTGSTMGTTQDTTSQPFDNQFSEQQPPPSGLLGQVTGTVANVAETAKHATMNAMEGGKNLARQASEGAKNLATGVWDKFSSMTGTGGPKP